MKSKRNKTFRKKTFRKKTFKKKTFRKKTFKNKKKNLRKIKRRAKGYTNYPANKEVVDLDNEYHRIYLELKEEKRRKPKKDIQLIRQLEENLTNISNKLTSLRDLYTSKLKTR